MSSIPGVEGGVDEDLPDRKRSKEEGAISIILPPPKSDTKIQIPLSLLKKNVSWSPDAALELSPGHGGEMEAMPPSQKPGRPRSSHPAANRPPEPYRDMSY